MIAKNCEHRTFCTIFSHTRSCAAINLAELQFFPFSLGNCNYRMNLLFYITQSLSFFFSFALFPLTFFVLAMFCVCVHIMYILSWICNRFPHSLAWIKMHFIFFSLLYMEEVKNLTFPPFFCWLSRFIWNLLLLHRCFSY